NRGGRGRENFLPSKRNKWNRSLSTRLGRTSIAVCAFTHQLHNRKPGRNGKPPRPRGKAFQMPSFDKERLYFEEVDAFELLEESPSPKKLGTWISSTEVDDAIIPHLSSVMRKWLFCNRLNRKYVHLSPLPKILETPVPSGGTICQNATPSSIREALENAHLDAFSNSNEFHNLSLQDKNLSRDSNHDICKDIELSIQKFSPGSELPVQDKNAFSALLTACGQSTTSTLRHVLMTYCGLDAITKIGEGTYGEAFKIGNKVCKIVPFDGDLKVNGELQKKSEELLEEVVLSCTLNHLRGHDSEATNACSAFIKTEGLRVCQGSYDSALISAWEEWDTIHGSENDNPKDFPENQRYVLFIQEHGGKDLESFVLVNFDEARSLIVQVTLALAVAEAAYDFEHRDLHWGNILLSRRDEPTVTFILEGKAVQAKTSGLRVSIIDFTLSRINSGEDILFLDLSSDPLLFEGPRGDIQAETYRNMRHVTGDCWEGSFPKTNVLWLQYLVEILLSKKTYERTSKNTRDLRSLKRRLNDYGSAKEAVFDSFFSELL
ncbi:hypothetical protein M569_09499, partial [Genlisea aurea]